MKEIKVSKLLRRTIDTLKTIKIKGISFAQTVKDANVFIVESEDSIEKDMCFSIDGWKFNLYGCHLHNPKSLKKILK